ncbi:MAG: pyruvate kinase [Verrucomicrobia bacterium]|nr:pyruvate kinase [Verrucomicrobiota bacterium]
MTRTKIICTIGPAVASLEKILHLIESGMNVARLNFSHGTHEEHLKSINLLKEARQKTGKPLAIMLDTKGPEIRLGKVPKGGIEVQPGDRLWLVKEAIEATSQQISLHPPFVIDEVESGTHILIDNGYIQAHIVETAPNGILIEFENHGVIHSSKGVNIPNIDLDLPAMTHRDIADIRFGCANGIDIVAASFIRCADHVLDIKKLLVEEKRPDVLVISKIENNKGVHNFDSILQVSDGIMIARGDLGVEVQLSRVPLLQKMMIKKCYLAGKPAVTATQMLESMIHNPRPTRAEASDVANAILDGTSAVMLSGETAVGKYPIETVQTMKSIIFETEQELDYAAFFEQHAQMQYSDVPSAITLATVKTASSLEARAIFAFTHGGSTARLLSRLRPEVPIIAFTPYETTYHQLAINWGVIPVLCSQSKTVDDAFKEASDYTLKNHYVSYGDLVVLTAGSPFWWVQGTTNTIRVESIGDVLVRGHGGFGSRVHGNITLLLGPESKKSYEVRDQIMVIPQYNERFMPLIREASGVILQNHIDDLESEKSLLQIAKTLQKPVIIRADAAFRTLREGQLVTLDPVKSIVYKGVIP